MVAPDKLIRGIVIDEELKLEIERRYNGWDDLRQQLETSQKREVILRDALRHLWNERTPDSLDEAGEALASTTNLDDLILCHAVEVGWIGTGPRDGRCEFSKSKPANSVMRDFNMKPLYRAREPKP